MTLPRCTLIEYESLFTNRHLIHGAVHHWAAEKPEALALINATRDTTITWAQLSADTLSLAAELLRRGYQKGDFLATTLPLLNDHVILEYACFQIGVIHVPLDLRLSPAEVARSLEIVQPRQHITSAAALSEMIDAGRRNTSEVTWPVVQPADGAQVIFTTGSTGRPKAALLTHGSITSQNYCLGGAFEFSGSRLLVNLPASHVGGQAELLMSTFFWGGTAVTLETFDPGKSLEAIETYKIRIIGQIPAMFMMEWRHSDYAKRDLSSLEIVVYGGQAVPPAFLQKLKTMAPRIATGLGLTEASGFCTYTEPTGDMDALAASIGHGMPLYPLTIREPLHSNGAAGAELPQGAIGHVCFQGPQTFAGYVNDPDATSRAISNEGILYTGDMGFLDTDGLHFSGRAKWVIKPAGYTVFPGDVENHLAELSEKVAAVGVVGVEHPIWVEAIIAFVEKRPGVELTDVELKKHARSLTSYMRPLHYVVVEPGQLPLNRVAKIDTLRLQDLAAEEVRQLKLRGRWGSDEESQESIVKVG
ncbi:class I adenylate-forming enzyme family protein [Paludibaculum fermentans]|uniref:AMP-binding protein n=1 Tax=Paludibaculum fermentans TaxID=1473598 RepID=A0A7S7NV35_PALFE|nr:AMP-binding protein [Paludibaculum fermentans]QOY90300.1 AMP-binding protein [Paludibaculum fermentans]